MKGTPRRLEGSCSCGEPEIKTKGTACVRESVQPQTSCRLSHRHPKKQSRGLHVKPSWWPRQTLRPRRQCDNRGNHHFEIHGDQRFVFDNEDTQRFHRTQPWRSRGVRLNCCNAEPTDARKFLLYIGYLTIAALIAAYMKLGDDSDGSTAPCPRNDRDRLLGLRGCSPESRCSLSRMKR